MLEKAVENDHNLDLLLTPLCTCAEIHGIAPMAMGFFVDRLDRANRSLLHFLDVTEGRIDLGGVGLVPHHKDCNKMQKVALYNHG